MCNSIHKITNNKKTNSILLVLVSTFVFSILSTGMDNIVYTNATTVEPETNGGISLTGDAKGGPGGDGGISLTGDAKGGPGGDGGISITGDAKGGPGGKDGFSVLQDLGYGIFDNDKITTSNDNITTSNDTF